MSITPRKIPRLKVANPTVEVLYLHKQIESNLAKPETKPTKS